MQPINDKNTAGQVAPTTGPAWVEHPARNFTFLHNTSKPDIVGNELAEAYRILLTRRVRKAKGQESKPSGGQDGRGK
jgi:hypothetical protein